MKTLYVTDLDGTLLTDDKKISPYSQKALQRLINEGVAVTFATARSDISAGMVAGGFCPKIPAVTMGGTYLTDFAAHKPAFSFIMNPEAVRKTAEVFVNCGRPPMIYSEQNGLYIEYSKIKSEYERQFIAERNRQKKCFYKVEEYSFLDNTVFINGIDKKEVTEKICRSLDVVDGIKFVNYPEMYSDGLYIIEVSSADAGKWNAIKKLKEMYGFERVVVFGDNDNDADMLKGADYAVAVSNAKPGIKALAAEIIGSNNEDSVVKFILSSEGK